MSGKIQSIVVSGAFDNIGATDLRLLEEAAKLGELTVLLWPDEAGPVLTGRACQFPLAERLYFLNAVRYVSRVIPVTGVIHPDELPLAAGVSPVAWVDCEAAANPARRAFCQRHHLEYVVLGTDQLNTWPEPPPMPSTPGHKKVVVTGCYDWFHSGHVRFTEEVSAYGDLYVIVGHDANIRLLKGEGHPLLPEAQRRYVVGSIKYVTQALISSGEGWLDADPEIKRIHPDIYAVNEDGDKGGKREYCRQRGMEYLVLKRTPAPGLPRRRSTDLRGF
jgi:cytidyltransferase-like protein